MPGPKKWTSRTFESVLFTNVFKTDSCWIWIGCPSKSTGYGKLRFKNKFWSGHRFVYEHLVGPIPDGLQLDHLCRNRICVNPDHLEPVTCKENLLRGDTFNSRNASKTHCLRGHEFNDRNTYWQSTKGGRLKQRRCRACHAARMRPRNRLYAQRRREQMRQVGG